MAVPHSQYSHKQKRVGAAFKCKRWVLPDNVGNCALTTIKELSNAEGGHHLFLNLLFGFLLAHGIG